jgi:hypothetical protein
MRIVVFLQHSYSYFLVPAYSPNVFIVDAVHFAMLLPGLKFIQLPTWIVDILVKDDHCTGHNVVFEAV